MAQKLWTDFKSSAKRIADDVTTEAVTSFVTSLPRSAMRDNVHFVELTSSLSQARLEAARREVELHDATKVIEALKDENMHLKATNR